MRDLASAHQESQKSACYDMTLTAETKDPKFETRLVLEQFCTHLDHRIDAQT